MGIETLAALSLGSTLVGGAVSYAGSQQTAAANKASALYQAQVATNNQTLANQAAARQEQAAGTAAELQSRKVAQTIGAQRAAFAAAGVDVNSGTAVDVQEGTAQTGRFDVLNTLNSALDRAYGTRLQAGDYGNQASASYAKASNAGREGALAGLTSLTSTASSFSSKWAGFTRTGAIPSFGE